jgi:hypothetical protein
VVQCVEASAVASRPAVKEYLLLEMYYFAYFMKKYAVYVRKNGRENMENTSPLYSYKDTIKMLS